MLLGSRTHGAGDHTRYTIDYSDWLSDGETLTSATITMDPTDALTVTDVLIEGVAVKVGAHVPFTLSGGTANETFTLDVQAVTSRNQVKNDTITFTVVDP